MAKKSRADDLEMSRRLLVIQQWIIDGHSTTVIKQQVIAQGWCESERHAFRMIKSARLLWLKEEEMSIDDEKKIQIRRLMGRINGMNAQEKKTPKGLNTILQYEKEISRLKGHYVVMPKPYLPADEDYLPPAVIVSNDKDDVDYEKLSDDVLMAIAAARKIND